MLSRVDPADCGRRGPVRVRDAEGVRPAVAKVCHGGDAVANCLSVDYPALGDPLGDGVCDGGGARYGEGLKVQADLIFGFAKNKVAQ